MYSVRDHVIVDNMSEFEHCATKKKKKEQASVTSITVGRDIHQNFRVCKVKLATLKVTINCLISDGILSVHIF